MPFQTFHKGLKAKFSLGIFQKNCSSGVYYVNVHCLLIMISLRNRVPGISYRVVALFLFQTWAYSVCLIPVLYWPYMIWFLGLVFYQKLRWPWRTLQKMMLTIAITPLWLPNVLMTVTLRLCWASYGAPTLWMIPSLFLFTSQWLVVLTQCEDDILPMFWCWNLPVRTSNYFQSCICSHASFFGLPKMILLPNVKMIFSRCFWVHEDMKLFPWLYLFARQCLGFLKWTYWDLQSMFSGIHPTRSFAHCFFERFSL